MWRSCIVQSFELQAALDITTRIVALGLVLSGFEMLAVRSQWNGKGVFSLGVISSFHINTNVLRAVDRYVETLLGVQIGAALLLVAAGPFTVIGRWMLVITFLSAIMVRWRRLIGGDGAEQMAVIVLVATGLAVLPYPSETRVWLAVIFIVAQISLSYTTSGIAKLVSPIWRSGKALPAILSTYSHGHPWAASILSRYSKLAIAASWSVILFECLFPLLFLGPGWLVAVALVIGLMFHVICAFLMGLNSFLWAFPAVYPCVIAMWLYWSR
jgi:hypothetical protein